MTDEPVEIIVDEDALWEAHRVNHIEASDAVGMLASVLDTFEERTTPATYLIRRFHRDEHPDNRRVIRTGLTLAEAQEHCNDPATHEEGVWFDGYEREDR